jgi:hypothetical protein
MPSTGSVSVEIKWNEISFAMENRGGSKAMSEYKEELKYTNARQNKY